MADKGPEITTTLSTDSWILKDLPFDIDKILAQAPVTPATVTKCPLMRRLRFGYNKTWSGSASRYVYWGGIDSDHPIFTRKRSVEYMHYWGGASTMAAFLSQEGSVEITYEEALARSGATSLMEWRGR